MSEVKTYRAATMRDALALVRRELGPDAVILHTQQVEMKRILPWARPRQAYEITAGTEINIRPPQARPKRRAGGESGMQTIDAVTPEVVAAPASEPSPINEPQVGATEPRLRRPHLVKEGSEPPRETAAVEVRSSRAEFESLANLRPLDAVSESEERVSHTSLSDAATSPVTAKAPEPAAATAAATAASETTGQPAAAVTLPEEALRQLDQIHELLKRIGDRPQIHAEDVPDELFHMYTELIERDVEQSVARDLVVELKRELGPEKIRDVALCRRTLSALIEAGIRTTPPIVPRKGPRKVVALVGPTGVGKTTTIAKLAANFRLRDGIRMGLVTVDTYRIAAVEQLRTYAEIIDLPMKVVTSPAEMRRALDEFSGLDLVLVDTAGRSPKDDLKIQELKSLLGEGLVDEVHLVLSLVSSLSSIFSTVEKFSAVNPTSAILTKLDEAAGPGVLLSLSRKLGLPISYLTTGQDVPADIEPANASRITRMITGTDS